MKQGNYHHGDLRNAMIQAALRLVEREGPQGFSMRQAAREAGVAPSAPYRHFEDKAALMTAVAEVALEELMERTTHAVEQAGDDPIEQYRASGIEYVVFAAERPAHFRVLHDTDYADASQSPLLAEYHERSDALMHAVLAHADTAGQLDASLGPEVIELAASTMMYGLARRIVDGHFGHEINREQVRALADQMTLALGVGIVNLG